MGTDAESGQGRLPNLRLRVRRKEESKKVLGRRESTHSGSKSG